MSPSRRRLLALGGASLAGLAGCAGLRESEPNSPRLVGLSALNYDTSPHTLHLLIQRVDEDEPTFERSVELPAGDPEEPTGTGELDGYPVEPGDAVFSVWRDDQSLEEARQFDFGEWEAECVGLGVNIGEYRVDPPSSRVAIWRTANCRG